MFNALNRRNRRILAGIALVSIMALAVQAAKKTQWASLVSSPPEKQKGAVEALVALVEFSDFQCPSCKRAQPILQELFKNYPRELRLLFKHYPLENRHPYARMAASAAECAKDQKKFWEFHDRLFDKQEEWSAAKDEAGASGFFEGYAKELQLDTVKWGRCLQSPATQAAIDSDSAEGDAKGVESTPTFFLNRYMLSGAGQLHREGARLVEIEIRNAKR